MTDVQGPRATKEQAHMLETGEPRTGEASQDTAAFRRRWLVLVVILSATFMQLLDVSIVGVAIASIQRTLGASYADTQLVLVAYQIGFAATLILAARLGDIYGRRTLFLVGMASFTAASIACGLAGSIDVLLVSRAVQGVASALMFAQVLAFIQLLFDAKERGAALGAYGTTIGLGTILGPVVGGALIQAGITTDAWRPIFLVNVPIGVGAFTAAVVLLPASRAARRPRLDVVGALLSAAGLGAVLYALSEGRDRSWPTWLLALLVAGLAVLAGFAVYEGQLSRAGRDPILDTALFADRAFRVGAALNVVFYAGVPGFFLVFSIYLQAGQGFSALGTGLAIFGYAAGAAVTASSADGIATKIGNRILLLGTLGLIAGMLTLIATSHLVGTHPHVWSWIPGMALSGLGFGLFVPPVIDIVLANVAPERAGTASGTLATVQQVGGALGVAVIGIIFFGLVGHNAPSAAVQTTPTLRAALSTSAATGTGPGGAALEAGSADDPAGSFTRCFTLQARATDPTVTPPGCATPAGTPARSPVPTPALPGRRRPTTSRAASPRP